MRVRKKMVEKSTSERVAGTSIASASTNVGSWEYRVSPGS